MSLNIRPFDTLGRNDPMRNQDMIRPTDQVLPFKTMNLLRKPLRSVKRTVTLKRRVREQPDHKVEEGIGMYGEVRGILYEWPGGIRRTPTSSFPQL